MQSAALSYFLISGWVQVQGHGVIARRLFGLRNDHLRLRLFMLSSLPFYLVVLG